MDWVKFGSAALMLAMVIYLFPRAKEVVKNSPKGSMNDWMGVIVPMVAIVLFIMLLIALV